MASDDNLSHAEITSSFFSSTKSKPENSVAVTTTTTTIMSNTRELVDLTDEPPSPLSKPENNHQDIKQDEEKNPFSKFTFDANPFAQFAFGSVAASNESNISSGENQKRRWIETNSVNANNSNKEPQNAASHNKKTKKDGYIPMKDLSVEEQERIRLKWHGLIVFPETSTVEECRFQIFVACRLHARCQESVVSKCMERLHEAKLLNVEQMARSDPAAVALLIKSLQFYNVKAQQIVEASKQLIQDFRGIVPESNDQLKRLKGVGPVMADIMSHVNTRASFQTGEKL